MKTGHLLVALVAAAAGLPLAEAGAPKVGIEDAARIAQAHLKERGLTDRLHVQSLVLEPETMARSKFHWYAAWSQSLELEPGKRELGLQINMDGSLARVVEGKQGRSGLKDYRTRADRPSILYLKH